MAQTPTFSHAAQSAGIDPPARQKTIEADPVPRIFTHFSAVVPKGWTAEEIPGFHSGDKREYLLRIGRPNRSGMNPHVFIFLLPNEQHASARDIALQAAALQIRAEKPVEKNGFWTFSGDPRNRRSRRRIRINATEDVLLIIDIRDPRNAGAETVLESLRGITPEAARLLGQKLEAAKAAQ